DKVCNFKFNLNNKVRANKELISFINRLFYKDRVLEKLDYKGVNIIYHNNIDEVKKCSYSLQKSGYNLINLTPSQYDRYPYEEYSSINAKESAHTVIGQEFENIVAIIDEN